MGCEVIPLVFSFSESALIWLSRPNLVMFVDGFVSTGQQDDSQKN